MEVIPQDVDNGFRQSLIEGKLKFANEYSLRKRLLELIDRIAPNVPVGFLASKEGTREFISKVCDTRNYLTHYSPELQYRAATQASELGKVARQLGVLVEICFLVEIGFGFNAIREMKPNPGRYKYILQ